VEAQPFGETQRGLNSERGQGGRIQGLRCNRGTTTQRPTLHYEIFIRNCCKDDDRDGLAKGVVLLHTGNML
jgi:hypothetical protein